MKKSILILSLLLLTLLPAHAVKKIEANPINIAFILADETDPSNMASICDYYGYVSQPSQDGYTVYKHPKNNSIIRYTFKEASEAQPYPYVEVKSKHNSKDVDLILTDLNFQKEGSVYIRKISQYARKVFQCKHGSQGFLIFHQTKIPLSE